MRMTNEELTADAGKSYTGQHAQITLCEFGLGGAFYRRSLTLVCVFMFKCDCQDLCNDVFNGVARKMQRLLAIAAAPCAVSVAGMVSFR